MADRLRYDGIETYLAAQLDDSSTTIQLANHLVHDGGADVQSFAEGQYLTLSILDANYRLREIVYLRDYVSGLSEGTIERGMEGTAPQVHAKGSKVVHAATVNDFLMVQDHADDPQAHDANIRSIVDAAIAAAIAAHRQESSNPHDYYLKRVDPTLMGTVTFDGNSTTTVNGTFTIAEGTKLVVDGELVVNGGITINGKRLVISNTEPEAASSNTVWIRTFG